MWTRVLGAKPGPGLKNRKTAVSLGPSSASPAWGGVAKLLHWLMAVLIFAQFVLGWAAVGWRLSPAKLNLFVWHKSIGLLLLALVVVRVGWRLFDRRPPWPPSMRASERTAAIAVHGLLYVFMIALPLSGWIINSAARVPFRAFWLIPVPHLVPADKALEELAKQVHFALFLGLAVALTLHIAAALRHHFVYRDEVLVRMLPGRGTRP